NKRLHKSKLKNKIKKIVITFLILLMISGIKIVNDEIKRKDFLENSNLLKLNLQKKTFDFLGERYYLDLNIIKENLSKIKNIL
ncbi:MAG: hypothetical protein ACTHW2_03655, partial [Tissierella sp.]|uniref:hypothetical protein n=1 Tax=Tissierella sp. TaxID=41274 RepID=UPI003F95F4BE